MNLSCYIPDWILKTFRVNTDRSTCRSANVLSGLDKAQVDAYQFYDGLRGKSPNTELSFTLYAKDANGNLTGAATRKTTSVASLALLSGDWQEKTNRLQSVFDRLKRDGLLVDGTLDANGQRELLVGQAIRVTQQTRSSHFADPTDILRAPFVPGAGEIVDPYYPTDPRGIPARYPNIRNAPTVSLTPRVLDRSLVSQDSLRQVYIDLMLAVCGHLKARNAVPLFHPLMIAQQAHISPNRWAYSNLDNESGSKAIAEWAEHNADPEYLLQHTVLGFKFPDGDQNQGPQFGGESSWIWEQSLARRFPITIATGTTQTRGAWDDRDRKTSWNIYTADALLELQRLVNVAAVLLSSGNASADPRAAMVDVFACQGVYSMAQERAYIQVGRPYGSNVAGYRERIAAEAQARKVAQRGSLGVPGYQSSGDDAADITMGTIGCVALAVSDALKTGGFPVGLAVGIVSFLIRGCALMATFLGGPDTQPNPFDYPIRMGSGRAPAFNGITVKNALEQPPVFRVS